MQQRIGVIDLGSNTTRLIVMGYQTQHSFKLQDEVRETVRLAEGVGADGRLQLEPMRRAVATMRLFHNFCRSTGVETILPVATSATREASNQAEFLAWVERDAGLRMRVLSAEEEAYYGYLGAINSLDLRDGYVIDIGGGSTQVTMVADRQLVRSFSRPIGALRASERFVRSDPISNRDFRALEQGVADYFTDLTWLRRTRGIELAGMGGTIRTLAEIDQKARRYQLDLVHGYHLSRESLAGIIEMLRGMTLRQRENLPGLNRDRADLILAGAVIIHTLLKRGKFDQLTISGQGLREGVFYEHFLADYQPPVFPDMRSFSIRNLARLYHFEEEHALKVQQLSLSLFDQLRPLHGYGPWERELLGYAALIHDIGVAVGYYDHHKHGAYLVVNAALQGFSHREMAILALLVQFHRKGEVNVEGFRTVLEIDDAMRVSRLASLLRIAEYLERRKSQVITGLHVELGDTVLVRARATGDASIEIWDANRRAAQFERAFGRKIEIVSG